MFLFRGRVYRPGGIFSLTYEDSSCFFLVHRALATLREINEELYKVLAHNVYVLVEAIHELGIEPIFCTEI